MRIVIDGDGCPNIDIITKLIIKYKLEAYLFCDTNHLIQNEFIKIINVDTNYQNVDMKISNFVDFNDLLITQDYGLATILIDKCFVINPRGMIYTKENIPFLLENRHINLKVKKGFKKLTNKDKKIFEINLEKLINKMNIK